MQLCIIEKDYHARRTTKVKGFGGDESFANWQYCIYTKRSGSANINLGARNPCLGLHIRRRVPGSR